MPQIILLVMKNCVRNRVRTLLTILGIAVGVIAFAFLQTVLAAYYIGSEASSPNRLVTRHRVSLFNLLPLSQKEKIEKIEGVKQVSWGMWFGGYYQDPKQFFGQIAVDDVMWDIYPEFLLAPEQKASFNKDLQGAVVGRKLAERYGWKIGDRITITGTIFSGNWDFIIDGIYTGRERTTDETTMYFHWKLVDERLRQFGRGSQIGWWVVGIDNPKDAGRISKDVDDLFINSSSPTLTETEKDFQLSFVAMMGTIITIIKMAAWIVIGIILLIMANTMAMAARERVTEYGVLKTLGFRAMHLGALIGGEALFVSFLGAAVGCAIAFAMIAFVGKFVEQNMGQIFPVFEMTPLTIGESIGLAMAAGLVACLVPMARAIRIPIADALRKVG
ncbi:MAG TPA: ABC transporter permease [Patescibacteria group bacterium]|jgi:putative ABC transport system permease protein|nr:ABC transporter permease [Patescibacteria group bacterium]